MKRSTPPDRAYRGRPQKARKARITVDLWCEILGDRDRAIGHIRNMNVGGCRLLSPSAFPLRETLSLILPGARSASELRLRAQPRWLALNPSEGPFELGIQFIHEGDSERQIEGMIKDAVKRKAPAEGPQTPSYGKFSGALEAARRGGSPSAQELRADHAARTLDRLTSRNPSAPLP